MKFIVTSTSAGKTVALSDALDEDGEAWLELDWGTYAHPNTATTPGPMGTYLSTKDLAFLRSEIDNLLEWAGYTEVPAEAEAEDSPDLYGTGEHQRLAALTDAKTLLGKTADAGALMALAYFILGEPSEADEDAADAEDDEATSIPVSGDTWGVEPSLVDKGAVYVALRPGDGRLHASVHVEAFEAEAMARALLHTVARVRAL